MNSQAKLRRNEDLDPLDKMPDLRIVGQPERAIRAGDDATQVAYVKRAAPVVEVGVGREGVELERASSGDAPDRHVHRSEPERPIAAAGDPAGRHIVRSALRIRVKQVQLPFRGDAPDDATAAEPDVIIRPNRHIARLDKLAQGEDGHRALRRDVPHFAENAIVRQLAVDAEP